VDVPARLVPCVLGARHVAVSKGVGARRSTKDSRKGSLPGPRNAEKRVHLLALLLDCPYGGGKKYAKINCFETEEVHSAFHKPHFTRHKAPNAQRPARLLRACVATSLNGAVNRSHTSSAPSRLFDVPLYKNTAQPGDLRSREAIGGQA